MSPADYVIASVVSTAILSKISASLA